MKIKFSGTTLIEISEALLILYLCLPITIALLNSFLIQTICIISSVFFVCGMIKLNRVKQLVVFLVIFIFLLLYWQFAWKFRIESISYLYYCFASVSFVYGGVILYKTNDSKLVQRLFYLLTFIYFITSITTILGLFEFPLACREYAREVAYNPSQDIAVLRKTYRLLNIASWSQVYGMMFAVPSLLLCWKKTKRLLFLAIMLAIELMIFASQITFAFLLSVCLLATSFITIKSGFKFIVFLGVLLIVAGICFINIDFILTIIISATQQLGLSFLTIKLDDLRILLVAKEAVGDAGARFELYQKSIETFFDNPVLGMLFSDNVENQIGFHSEFFDFIGVFGLIGIIILGLSFWGYSRFLNCIEKDERKDLRMIYLFFVFLFIFNPVFNSPQVFIGAFLYPILCCRFCKGIVTDNSKRKSLCFN